MCVTDQLRTDRLGAGDLGGGFDQVVRGRARVAWHGPVGAAGDRARRPRAERRGQDDRRAHPDHAAAAGRGAGPGGRARRGAGSGRGPPVDRAGRAVGSHSGGAHRAGEPRAHRAALPPEQGVRPEPCGRATGTVRPGRRGRPARQGLLRRHAAPPGPGGEPGGPPEGPVPRRADDRPGPAVAAGHVGHHPVAGRRGHDAAAHHPVSRRSRRAGQRDRGHRPRPGHRGGHGRAAEGPGRRGRAGVHRARPGPVQRRRHGDFENRSKRTACRRGDRRDQHRGREPWLRRAHRGGAQPGQRRRRDPWPGAATALARRCVPRPDRARRRGGRPGERAPPRPPQSGRPARRQGHREGVAS